MLYNCYTVEFSLIMRRDSIFYKLFKQFPSLLFELVEEPVYPNNRFNLL